MVGMCALRRSIDASVVLPEIWAFFGGVQQLGSSWHFLWEDQDTLPETNIAPKNGWLEYYVPIGKAYFQKLC